MEVPRAKPDEVRRQMESGSEDLELVCAYDDEEKCRNRLIAGAETMPHFRARLENIPLDRRIILYCG